MVGVLTAPASPGPIVSCRCQALFITPCHCQASRSLGRRQASDRCACTCRGTWVTHVSFQWPFSVWPLSGPFVSSRCQVLRVPALAVVRQVWHIGDLCFIYFAVVRPVWSRRCQTSTGFVFHVFSNATRRCQALCVPALPLSGKRGTSVTNVLFIWRLSGQFGLAVVRLLLDSYFTVSVTQLAVVKRCVSPPCRCQASMAHR